MINTKAKKKNIYHTSSSQVFLWAEDEGTQICPFSSEFSMARRRARDKSCLIRWFLELHPKVEGDSDPVTSITWGTGVRKKTPGGIDWLTAV